MEKQKFASISLTMRDRAISSKFSTHRVSTQCTLGNFQKSFLSPQNGGHFEFSPKMEKHRSSPRPKCLGHRCSKHNWSGLTAFADPPMALLHKVIQNQAVHLPDHCNSPRLARDALVWDLVQLSTDIPLQLLVSTTLLKRSHNYVLHSKPQHLNLSASCLGVENKASLWRWQRELLPLKGPQ